ncbi:MAG: hypothetical protein V3U02_06315 [Calditrichia bacterium]
MATLKSSDTAIILDEEGYQLFIPEIKHDEEESSDDVRLLIAIFMRLKGDEEFKEEQLDWFHTYFKHNQQTTSIQ